jgi:hypothetical protein
MREYTHTVKLDKYEQGLAITALNEKRNQLLREQRSTDAVDELLLKVIEAKSKKSRLRNEAR